MDTLDQLRLQRHAEHLHCCGPRMIAEVLAEISQQIGGGLPAIIALLAPYQRLTPTVLHVVGGDRFPSRPFRTVPK